MEPVLIGVSIVIVLFFLVSRYLETYQIVSVMFLDNDNIVVSVENANGMVCDFIGPFPHWTEIDGHFKPSKKLTRMLNDIHMRWILEKTRE
jgi:hypothetical protein